jgi:hypothetical protein
MYAALWRVLPGPVWVRVRVLELVGLALVVLVVLVTVVFPFAAEVFLVEESVVGSP